MSLTITVNESTWNIVKNDFNYNKLQKIIIELYDKENKIYSNVIFKFPVLNEFEINMINNFNYFDAIYLSKINEDKTFSISFSQRFLHYIGNF